MKHSLLVRRWAAAALAAAALLFPAVAAANCSLLSNFAERTPDSQFTDHGNGTVTHTAAASTGTGLMWKKCPQGRSGANCETGTATLLNWQQALREAVTDATGGYTDWRLPSMKELMSIVETGCRNPMINTTRFPLAFPQVQINALYWTSTPGPAREAGNGWAVDFNRGSAALLDKTTTHYARLVRLGKTALEDNYDRNTAVTGGPSPLPVFTTQTGVNLNAYIESNQVTLAGITGSVPISVAGGEYRINGGAYTSAPGTVATGNTVQLRELSAPLANTSSSVTLTINGQNVLFTVTTGSTNEPTNDGFVNLADLVTSVEIRSNTITVSGLTAAGRSIYVDGAATAMISINGSTTWVTSGTVSNGDTVQVRMTSSASTNTKSTANVYIHGRAYPFSITTRSGSSATQPANFIFPAKFDVAPSTVTTSDFVTVTGLSAGMSASCNYRVNQGTWGSCSGNNAMELNGSGTWSGSFTINNNSRLRARVVSSATPGGLAELRVTMNSRDYIFNVYTVGEPNDFTLREQTIVPRGAYIYSNIVMVEGLTASKPISVTGGEYRLSPDGFTWGGWTSTAGTIAINSYLQVRHVSSTSATTATTTTLTINSRPFTFKSTTGSALEVPGGLVFQEIYGAPPATTVQSNLATVTTLASPAAITVSGGTYQKNGAGGFVSTGGTISANDTIQMQVTTGACPNTQSTATLTANGYAFPFNVYTAGGSAQNAFSFASRTNVCAGAVIYSAFSPQLCSGWAGTASITGGTAPGIEKNDSGTWVAAAPTTTTVAAGDKVRVRQTAPAAGLSSTTNLTMNGTVVPFTVTTRGAAATDPPAAFAFADKAATASQAGVESNEVMVDLCTARTATLSVAGGGASPQYAYCNDVDSPCTTWGAWNNTGVGTIPVGGRAVKLKVNAGGAGTTTTVTMTINGVASTFRVLVP